jgi:DNA-binding CsgD family transcriptional regulator
MINKFLGLRVSDAERHVAKNFIRLGLTQAKMAEYLRANRRTLKNQMHSVYKKTGASSLSELQANYIKVLEERLEKNGLL